MSTQSIPAVKSPSGCHSIGGVTTTMMNMLPTTWTNRRKEGFITGGVVELVGECGIEIYYCHSAIKLSGGCGRLRLAETIP